MLSLFITFYTGEMVYYSLAFGDLTQGLVPIPLWVPQSGMMIGVTVLTLAFLCDGIRVLRGLEPTYLVAARADRQANINQEMI